ncbi:hypothetical protein D915_006016 [Fasciola hepatica]|uniref:Uncharacterized protein n=1 Tax=Fasciola hepatica TaxID=6192 RepID=A0A4E0S0B2_FASHE|nr:hypothetical protein D915_006016 [Fasciola hepatica]
MSAVFTSGKKSAAIVRGSSEGSTLKKKASQGSDTNLPANSYVPSENVVVWNVIMDHIPLSFAYCKDTASLWVGDELVQTREHKLEDFVQHDFCIMDHKAQLTVPHKPDCVQEKYKLLLDGLPVEQVELRSSEHRKS